MSLRRLGTTCRKNSLQPASLFRTTQNKVKNDLQRRRNTQSGGILREPRGQHWAASCTNGPSGYKKERGKRRSRYRSKITTTGRLGTHSKNVPRSLVCDVSNGSSQPSRGYRKC